jgi:hypothetical protein
VSVLVAVRSAQQELRQAVPGAHQIAAEILDAADQIPERLIGDRRHEREPQLPGGEQPDQADRVTG